MNTFIRKTRHALDYLSHNRALLADSIVSNFCRWLPDKMYISLRFRFQMGYWPNLKNPKTFNEKLQWLKLYNRIPEYTTMVDKYAVKAYVSSIIGEEYVIPTLGIWNRPEDIDWNKLPEQFVLKTTHGGGNTGVIICKDKSSFDKYAAIRKLKDSLKQDIYKSSREWPYKNIRKRIIAEKFLEDEVTSELRDYKFFCFGGKVRALFVATERQTRIEPFFNFFDRNFDSLDLCQGHPRAELLPDKPKSFEEMVAIAERLSKDIPHVRVDLYEANGKVFFGELTFYHFGGTVPFEPAEWDETFGRWIHLPKKTNL